MKNNVLIALIILIVAGVALYIYFNKNKNITPVINGVNNNSNYYDDIAKTTIINKIVSDNSTCMYIEADRSFLQAKSLKELNDIYANC